MRLWAKSLEIFNTIRAHGPQSVRRLATRTGLSKSSVHRHTQAMAGRNRHPESWLWETAEGRAWLIRLMVATLFIFGLKRGVGAETISEFFSRLRLEVHVGCSPSALRSVMQILEQTILETAAAWEDDGIAHGETRPIIGAVDETFLEHMLLVFMDLASGYLLVEEVADDRSYDTWYGVVKARLETLGVGVRYLVSDRAKALIKLAETGLECLSIPDLFHLIHDLAKSPSLAIVSRLRQAQQALTQAQACCAKAQASHLDGPAVQHAQALVEARETEVQHWQGVRNAYRHHLNNLSLIMYPWRLGDLRRQTSQEVERQLQAEVTALETLFATHALPVKKNALDKVRKPLVGVSVLVDAWWQEVWHDVQSPVSLTPQWSRWIEELLLPLMYWQDQLSRTRCRQRKASLLEALQAVEAAFERHPITQSLAPDVLADWKVWAGEHAKAFQRTSSAVEGRNGSLSQMHHNQRGLPKRRYKVWTILHNFDCRAADGTTPASRFFRREFPDLFETVLSTVDDLPRPRQRHQALAISD
jgi:protein required for attachment to host cells/AraC-like DNA-binding protein